MRSGRIDPSPLYLVLNIIIRLHNIRIHAMQRVFQTVVIGRCGGEERLAFVEGAGPPGECTWKFANKLIHDNFGGSPSVWAAELAWLTRSSRRFQLEVALASLLGLLIIAAIYWDEHASPLPNKCAELPASLGPKPAVSALSSPAGPHLVVGLQPYAGYAYLADDDRSAPLP
jgi:hypothetical protein